MKDWPYRRFRKAFDAYQRRRACDLLRERKVATIAALHGAMIENLAEVLADYERGFDAMIDEVWTGVTADEETQEIWDSKFMRAGRNSAHESVASIQMPGSQEIEGLPPRG